MLPLDPPALTSLPPPLSLLLSRYIRPTDDVALILFSADDGVHGRELWRTDGTATGTALVSDIRPGAIGSAPTNFAVFDGYVYFSADSDGGAAYGRELWRTDGVTATLVCDVFGGAEASYPSLLTAFDPHGRPAGWTSPKLYFGAVSSRNSGVSQSPIGAMELWSTDGTTCERAFQETARDLELDPAMLAAPLSAGNARGGGFVGYAPNAEGEESGARWPNRYGMASWRGALFYSGSAATTTAPKGIAGTGAAGSATIDQSFSIVDVDVGMDGGIFNITLRSVKKKGRLVLDNVRAVGADGTAARSGDHASGIVETMDGLQRELGRVTFARVVGMGDCSAVDASAAALSNSAQTRVTTHLGEAACALSFSGSLAAVNAALRSVRYIANPDATGEDAIFISVNDTGNSGVGGVALVRDATLDVWISAVNDAPTITAPASIPVNIDVGLNARDAHTDGLHALDGSQMFGIQVGDKDMDDATMVATLSLDLVPPQGASLTLASLVGLTFTRGGGVGHAALTAVGTLEHINRALYGMSFVCDSAAGCAGTKSDGTRAATVEMLVAIADGGQSGAGGELRTARSVELELVRAPRTPAGATRPVAAA